MFCVVIRIITFSLIDVVYYVAKICTLISSWCVHIVSRESYRSIRKKSKKEKGMKRQKRVKNSRAINKIESIPPNIKFSLNFDYKGVNNFLVIQRSISTVFGNHVCVIIIVFDRYCVTFLSYYVSFSL